MIPGITAGQMRTAAAPAVPVTLALGVNASPYAAFYDETAGVIAKLADPASMPTFNGVGAAVTRDGVYSAVCYQDAPRVKVYKRSGAALTKIADPATAVPGVAQQVAWSPSGQYLAITHSTGLGAVFSVYKRSGDTLTRLANPSTLPTTACRPVAWSEDGQYLAVCSSSQSSVWMYKLDTATDTLSALSFPTGTGSVRSAAFSPNGDYLALGYSSSPTLVIYKRTGDAWASMATVNSAVSAGVAWTSDSGMLVSVGGTANQVQYHVRSGDTFTSASVVDVPAGGVTATSCDIDPSDTRLAVGLSASPFVLLYDMTTWTKMANPAALPAGQVNAVAFNR